MAAKFELVFRGQGTVTAYKIPRHRRFHTTFESAQDAAYKVLAQLEQPGVRGAHSAIIYGPGCPEDGFVIA